MLSRVLRAAAHLAFSCLLLATAGRAQSADLPATLPDISYHLTSRPWSPLNIDRTEYLDAIEGICRFSIQHQDERGAIIDPFLRREHQYSTPYFAFAVGALVSAGRAPDLLAGGARAMDHATNCFAGGNSTIPDQHGEFFIAPLAGALPLYEGYVARSRLDLWRERLRTPLWRVMQGRETHTNNWRTYAMKGEWLRQRLGLVQKKDALELIRHSWLEGTQRERIAADSWNLYQDHSSDPESHAVEAVGRLNLLALLAEGYDRDLAGDIAAAVERGTRVSLLLQDPSGQCPPNGRADDHVFNDVVYQLAFELMSERSRQRGWSRLSGQCRRAAMLAFASIARWRRSQFPWTGSFFVTKNRMDPFRRVGYQPASNYSNYNGAVMYHLAEAYLARQSAIAEEPTPTEIGGYAFSTDRAFSSAVANAGGLQMFMTLRGDSYPRYDTYWSALGVLRFSRPDWDSRLGPSDGYCDSKTGRAVSFAPTWREDGKWLRLAEQHKSYQGRFLAQFAHPLLVRCAVEYSPVKDQTGPVFRHEFVLTPDCVLASLNAEGTEQFGVTLPVLENDGRPLRVQIQQAFATVSYASSQDEQSFLSLNPSPRISADEAILSSYGWLRPLRLEAPGSVKRVLIYPRKEGDPSAEAVLRSLHLTASGFSSSLGRVDGNLYVGPYSAGGVGDGLDLDEDGKEEIQFDQICGFLLRLEQGRIAEIEADRNVTARVANQSIPVRAFQPVLLSPR